MYKVELSVVAAVSPERRRSTDGGQTPDTHYECCDGPVHTVHTVQYSVHFSQQYHCRNHHGNEIIFII